MLLMINRRSDTQRLTSSTRLSRQTGEHVLPHAAAAATLRAPSVASVESDPARGSGPVMNEVMVQGESRMCLFTGSQARARRHAPA